MPTEGMTAVPVSYQPRLILLSIAMAMQGAFTGHGPAVQIGDAIGVRRRMLLARAAFSLAAAIWTMHLRLGRKEDCA
jgi:diguanylate cyclase